MTRYYIIIHLNSTRRFVVSALQNSHFTYELRIMVVISYSFIIKEIFAEKFSDFFEKKISAEICTQGMGIQEILDKHPLYLNMYLPQNENLDWIDHCNSKRETIYAKNTTWGKLGAGLQLWMILGMLCMSFSLYMFMLFDSDCFGEFTIQKPPWNELTFDYVVKPLGTVGPEVGYSGEYTKNLMGISRNFDRKLHAFLIIGI
jgi:hypothetical protein